MNLSPSPTPQSCPGRRWLTVIAVALLTGGSPAFRRGDLAG